jgi:hypothetical protein
MTREFGLVSTSIWNSRKFCGLKSDDARLLYFYLLTCPSVNSIGCYVLKPGYAAADLGWDTIRYQDGIQSLSEAGLIGIDRTENLVRIVGFLDHSEIMNVKHGVGAVRIALSLPDCDEKISLLRDLAAQKHVKREAVETEIGRINGTVSIPYREGIDKPEPKPEPKPEERTHPNGCDGDAVDPAKAVFDAGVQVLTGAGLSERQARAFVGKLRKGHPDQDGQILGAIMDCGRAGAVDPIPWITAALHKPKTPTAAEIMARISEDRPQ